MNALYRIHAALEPGGLVVDTQPVSAHPPVEAGRQQLGALDMREWRALIDEIDQLTEEVIDEGLFVLDHEDNLIVTDSYASGSEFLDTVGGWKGTRIPDALAARFTAAATRVHQTVRLRVLRSL